MSLVIVLKSVLLLVMVVLSTMFVLLPACILRIPRVKNGDPARRKFILSIFNCFGGGIFVATGNYVQLIVVSISLIFLLQASFTYFLK